MSSFGMTADERVLSIEFSNDAFSVSLQDGRVISVPLAWYPRLSNASAEQRRNWQIAGGGYGIYWPDIDEDLSTEGLLRGAAAPPAHSHVAVGRVDISLLLATSPTRPAPSSAVDAASIDADEQIA